MTNQARKRLICCAAPHGYGPASKLCRIASELRRFDIRPIFLGAGSALELARTSDAFDEIIDAPPGDPLAAELIDSAAALLSLMKWSGFRFYAQSSHRSWLTRRHCILW